MRINSDDKSLDSEEITTIFKNIDKKSKIRKREETYDQKIAASTKIEYWLNIINSNKTLMK